jgi:uncharacterized membrane protein YdbT with pleckstrin-like domain
MKNVFGLFSFLRLIISALVFSFIIYCAFKERQFGTFGLIVIISLVIWLILELIEIYLKKKELDSS